MQQHWKRQKWKKLDVCANLNKRAMRYLFLMKFVVYCLNVCCGFPSLADSFTKQALLKFLHKWLCKVSNYRLNSLLYQKHYLVTTYFDFFPSIPEFKNKKNLCSVKTHFNSLLVLTCLLKFIYFAFITVLSKFSSGEHFRAPRARLFLFTHLRWRYIRMIEHYKFIGFEL